MRVLLIGSAPFIQSAYGIQLTLLAKKLRQAGHTIVWSFMGVDSQRGKAEKISQKFVMEQGFIEETDYTYYSTFKDQHDLQKLVDKEKVNQIITLMDVGVFFHLKGIEQKVRRCRMTYWLPVHYNPLDEYIVKALKLADEVWCLCQFGKDACLPHIEEEKIKIVPHEIIKHENMRGREELRREKEIPLDTFVCLMVAANNDPFDRKAFDCNIGAFARHVKEVKPDSLLILHTNTDGEVDVKAIVEYFGVEDKVIYSEEKLEHRKVCELYVLSDLLLSCSRSEGFGIPIVEAQQYGCKVLVTGWSAMPEMVREGMGRAVGYHMVSVRYTDIKDGRKKTQFWAEPEVDNLVV